LRKRVADAQEPHDHDHQAVPSDVALRVKALESLLVEKGMVDRAALDAVVDSYETKIGPRNGARVVARAWVDPAYKKRLLTDGTPAIAELGSAAARVDNHVKPRFKIGHHVRGRTINPLGHTRLPRYARGRRGTIARDHGQFAFQDTDVNGDPLSQTPQHVYTVRFEARELWGDQAGPHDGVYVDLWDDHLERA